MQRQRRVQGRRDERSWLLLRLRLRVVPSHVICPPLLLRSAPQPAHQFATGGYGENANETDVFAPWAFGGLADPACERGRVGCRCQPRPTHALPPSQTRTT